MAPRTQEERDQIRKKLFANELRFLRQAEVHWDRASGAWEERDKDMAQTATCRAKAAESRAARCRSRQEFLDWEEDLAGTPHRIRDLEEMKDYEEDDDDE